MLISDIQKAMDQHVAARQGLEIHFNKEMEKIIKANEQKREIYWILGKVRTFRQRGKDIMRPFLEACEEKPPVIRESFVYEVDNTRGVKSLLWVMHPGDLLSFPTLGKSIRVSGEKTGSTILLPG